MLEVEEFKQVIRALINAGANPCSEQDIRRAYWLETGFSVDGVLQKVVQQVFLKVNNPNQNSFTGRCFVFVVIP